jgi:dihydroxyacetone kinase-like protein
MKKFINKTDNFIIDSLKGFAKAHDDLVELSLDPIFVTRKKINSDKVLLVSGGDLVMNPCIQAI